MNGTFEAYDKEMPECDCPAVLIIFHKSGVVEMQLSQSMRLDGATCAVALRNLAAVMEKGGPLPIKTELRH